MKKYINGDVEIKEGSLKALKVTKEEFVDALIENAIELCREALGAPWREGYSLEDYLKEEGHTELLKYCQDGKFYSLNLFEEAVSVILYADEYSSKNVSFDVENWNCIGFYFSDKAYVKTETINDSYTQDDHGVQENENGLVYVGFDAGGDWEDCTYSILYLDENRKIACYTPLKGNPVCIRTMMPFGNDDDEEELCFFDYDSPQIQDFEDLHDIIIKSTGIEDWYDWENYDPSECFKEEILKVFEVVEK